LKVVSKSTKWVLLAPVIPRIALLAFTFCQPLLLRRFLQFLQDGDEKVNVGYGMIAAYALVYFGMSVSVVSMLVDRLTEQHRFQGA
jgi:hypothetical protein